VTVRNPGLQPLAPRRPARIGAMLVLVQVSSMNTSRRGSRRS
jgi:hypothetical protein